MCNNIIELFISDEGTLLDVITLKLSNLIIFINLMNSRIIISTKI